MANVCDYCQKGRVIGRQSRHRRGVAGKQWAKRAPKTTKVFKPNLHWATIAGARLRLCTRCLKKLKSVSKPAPAA